MEGFEGYNLSAVNLLQYGVYSDLYEPHFGPTRKEGQELNFGSEYRSNLTEWTRKTIPSPVPLSDIRDYFGETVAIFFAWLDFYTSSFRYAMFFALFPIFYGFYMVWVDNISFFASRARRTLQ